MNPLTRDLLASLAQALHLGQIARGTAYLVATLAVIFPLFYLLERRAGADTARYRSRAFRTDLIYTFIYRGGLFGAIFFAPLAAVLDAALSPYYAKPDLPQPAAILLSIVVTDLVAYWTHRIQHAVPALWAFHSVHHSQKRLTFATISRVHPLDFLLVSLTMYLPMFVCGVQPALWYPLALLRTFHEFCLHAELDWKFGPLYGVVTSPTFHAIHHSTAASSYVRNLGGVFTFWDTLFGTASKERRRPDGYGIEGEEIPERILGQLAAPFVRLSRRDPAHPPEHADA